MPTIACLDCGREVSTEARVCPQCGRPWPGRIPVAASNQPATTDADWNGLAITAFVLACATPLIPILLAIPALAFGIIARKPLNEQAALGQPEQKGRWMAVTGIAVGGIFLAVWVLLGGFLLLASRT